MATAWCLDSPPSAVHGIADQDIAARLDISLPRLFTSAAVLPRPGQRAIAQARRRAAILAAARSLFSEGGARGVTVRALAARSGVGAPTIYKLIGGRGKVIEQALLEGLAAPIEQTHAVAGRYGVNIISAFVETLWRATVLHPAYSRQLVNLCMGLPGGRRVGAFLRAEVIAVLTLWLLHVCDPERLAPLGGADVLARTIEAQLRIAFNDWADGSSSLPQLRRDLALGAAALLTGLIDEAEQRRLRVWIAPLAGSAMPYPGLPAA